MIALPKQFKHLAWAVCLFTLLAGVVSASPAHQRLEEHSSESTELEFEEECLAESRRLETSPSEDHLSWSYTGNPPLTQTTVFNCPHYRGQLAGLNGIGGFLRL